MSKDIKKALKHCIDNECVGCPNNEELGSGETVCRGRLLPEVLEYVADLEAKLAEKDEQIKRRIAVYEKQFIEQTNENCELKQQLAEKEKEIRQLDNEKGMLLNNSMKLLKEKDDRLKSQPAEIVEKIKEFVDGNAYYYEEEQYAKHIIKYLGDILKEYQK